MEIKKISKQFLVAGTILIWTIKFLVRPLHAFDQPMSFFLGIAPNLFGAFLIPFGAYWLFSGKDFLMARIFRLHSNYDLRLVCLMGMGMLIVNEYLQLIPFFGRTFDVFDILFSSVGLGASYFVFGRIQQRYQVSPS